MLVPKLCIPSTNKNDAPFIGAPLSDIQKCDDQTSINNG